MKFKSALVTQVSGSVGGMTGSHNQGGMYFRARAIPVNPSTAEQQVVRNAMLALASNWQNELTDAQRTAWATYAANVPIKDSLGDVRFIGAIAQYQRSNIPRIQAGLDVVNDGPTVMSLPSFTLPSMTITAASPAVASVTFTNTDDWANEDGGAMLVYLSRQQSPTINFFKGPYQFAGDIAGDSTTAPTSPATITSPFAASSGNKVHAQVRITRADGRLSSTFRTVITAP